MKGATIYGEIAFAAFRTLELGGAEVASSLVVVGAVGAGQRRARHGALERS